jgi:tetratricopeptide (TPR) repeat protein
MDDRIRKLLDLGRAAYTAGDFDVAEKYLEEVLNSQFAFADVHNILGVIYHHRGEYGRARERFEEALRINPRYTDAALNLSVTYNHLGMFDEAKALYAGALSQARGGEERQDPFILGKLANMHADIGDAYASAEMFSDAVREYRRAIHLRPDFPDLRTRLANTLRDTGDLEGAALELSAACDRQPNYIPARLSLGVTLLALGRLDEAKSEWEEILKQEPNHTRARFYLQMAKTHREELLAAAQKK